MDKLEKSIELGVRAGFNKSRKDFIRLRGVMVAEQSVRDEAPTTVH